MPLLRNIIAVLVLLSVHVQASLPQEIRLLCHHQGFNEDVYYQPEKKVEGVPEYIEVDGQMQWVVNISEAEYVRLQNFCDQDWVPQPRVSLWGDFLYLIPNNGKIDAQQGQVDSNVRLVCFNTPSACL